MNKRISKKKVRWLDPICPICHGEIDFIKDEADESTSACVKCKGVVYKHKEADITHIIVNGRPYEIDDNLPDNEWRQKVGVYEKVVNALRKHYRRTGGVRRVSS